MYVNQTRERKENKERNDANDERFGFQIYLTLKICSGFFFLFFFFLWFVHNYVLLLRNLFQRFFSLFYSHRGWGGALYLFLFSQQKKSIPSDYICIR